MKMIDAIELAMADHKAMHKGKGDYEFLDALEKVANFLRTLGEVVKEGSNS
jgi:hypothetical protein